MIGVLMAGAAFLKVCGWPNDPPCKPVSIRPSEMIYAETIQVLPLPQTPEAGRVKRLFALYDQNPTLFCSVMEIAGALVFTGPEDNFKITDGTREVICKDGKPYDKPKP